MYLIILDPSTDAAGGIARPCGTPETRMEGGDRQGRVREASTPCAA